MSPTVNNLQLEWQRKVTKALLQFCEDHRYPSLGLAEVRECLKALQQNDMKSASEFFQKVPLGGRMGYFDDWYPPVVFPHESQDFVQVVFQALLNEWDRVMKLPSKS